jgi:hypothetical protein
MSKATTQPTPAILDLEKAIDEFRQTVHPLIEPTQEKDWDGVKLKSKEAAILQAGLRLVGHCIAILIYQLVLSQSVQMAASLRATGQVGLPYISEGYREVAITLIGGVEVRVPTLYKLARKARKGRGRKKKEENGVRVKDKASIRSWSCWVSVSVPHPWYAVTWPRLPPSPPLLSKPVQL